MDFKVKRGQNVPFSVGKSSETARISMVWSPQEGELPPAAGALGVG